LVESLATRFDWDDGNRRKCQKHGVSLDEIEAMVSGPTRRIAPDIKHSATEQRFVAVGRSPAGRPMFVVFTLRGQLIRPLSARYIHAKEARKYEEST
jgi:uncharacterized protein